MIHIALLLLAAMAHHKRLRHLHCRAAGNLAPSGDHASVLPTGYHSLVIVQFDTDLWPPGMMVTEDIEDEYVVVNDWHETTASRHKAAVKEWALKYEELESSKHFRLLKLKSKKCDEEVFCSLRQCEIDASPPYEALSYTWGNRDPTHVLPIYNTSLEGCSGRVMYIHISPNLFKILSHFRDPDDGTWLWVDALCIDQLSYGQRNQQVRLMGTIYGKAFKVVACLDSDDLSPQTERDVLTGLEFLRTAMRGRGDKNATEKLAGYCGRTDPCEENRANPDHRDGA